MSVASFRLTVRFSRSTPITRSHIFRHDSNRSQLFGPGIVREGYVGMAKLQGHFGLIGWVTKLKPEYMSRITWLTAQRAWNCTDCEPRTSVEPTRCPSPQTDWKWSDFVTRSEGSGGGIRYDDHRANNGPFRRGKIGWWTPSCLDQHDYSWKPSHEANHSIVTNSGKLLSWPARGHLDVLSWLGGLGLD